MILTLVRHGDVHDPAGFATPLTGTGAVQILELARRLKASGVAYAAIYTSQYARARHSANIIWHIFGLPIQARDELNEVGYGREVKEAWEGDAARRFLGRVIGDDENAIIVSHGYPIQVMALSLGHPDGVCARGECLTFEVKSGS